MQAYQIAILLNVGQHGLIRVKVGSVLFGFVFVIMSGIGLLGLRVVAEKMSDPFGDEGP